VRRAEKTGGIDSRVEPQAARPQAGARQMVHRRSPRPPGGCGDRRRVAVAAYSGQQRHPIQPYDQDVWAETFDYIHRDSKESLEFFRVLRARNLALLKRLPKNLWENYGVHQERGKESVARIVRLYAGYDLEPNGAGGEDREPEELGGCKCMELDQRLDFDAAMGG
jgi:hypothetical protein